MITLGKALHECGATSQRIELHLCNVCDVLEIHGNFLISPTTFTCVFWLDSEYEQFTHIERIQPSGDNLGRLWEIDQLVESIANHEISCQEGLLKLEQINITAPYYKGTANALSWALIGGSFAALLSTNWADVICSSILALLIFCLYQLSSQRQRFANVVEILAPMTSGVLASALASFGVQINVPFVILSSIVVFIPGLALTTALSEISSKNLIAGTSRLVDSTMQLFKLYFGAILGVTIASLIIEPSTSELVAINNMPSGKTYPALLVLSGALTVAFNIRWQKALWGLASASIAYGVASQVEQHIGMFAGVFLGAMAVGIYSNLFSRIKNAPSSIPLNQGLILLVPGSKVYMLLNSWVAGTGILASSASGNQAFMIFISLIAGILFANALLPTKKSL